MKGRKNWLAVARAVAEALSGEELPDWVRELVDAIGDKGVLGELRARPQDKKLRKSLARELSDRAEREPEFAKRIGDIKQRIDGDGIAVAGDGNVTIGRVRDAKIKNDHSRKRWYIFVPLFVTIGGATTAIILLTPGLGAGVTSGDKADTATSVPSRTHAPDLSTPGFGPSNGPNTDGGTTSSPTTGTTTTPQKSTATTTSPVVRAAQLSTTSDLAQGLPGTSVNFYGAGYSSCPDQGHRTVDVLWDGQTTGNTVPIGSDGRFAIRFTVPESAGAGEHAIYGRCTDGGESARSAFTVTPPLAVSVAPTRGRAGASVTVHGTEYGGCPDYGDRTVNVNWDNNSVATGVPIQPDGTFTVTVKVPAGSSQGDHYVTGQCYDGGQSARTIFTVTP